MMKARATICNVYACSELIYWMFNSDPIYYYANHLFLNIYAFIQSDIVQAVLFNLVLYERRGVRAQCLLIINHYTGWDWLPGVWRDGGFFVNDISQTDRGQTDRWFLC